MNKHLAAITLSIATFFLSCGDGKEDISTYVVSKKNFENLIVIEGITEPTQSINIVGPRAYSIGEVSYLIEDGVYVNKGDTLCVIKNSGMESTYDEQRTNLENMKVGFEKSKADLYSQYALLVAQVKNNEAQTQIANLDSLQLQYYSPKQRRIKELELKKASIEKEKYSQKLKILDVIQQTEIKKLELEIQRTEMRVNSTKQMLDAMILLAPSHGLATRAISMVTGRKFNVGDNVYPNMPIISLPIMDQMKVKIMASETDYKYINIGDSVAYTFDAMPGNMGWGKIRNKVPVGKELSEGSKVKLFEIEASIDSVLTMPEAGFSVNCRIYMKQIKDTITIPQIAVFDKDSIKVVYIDSKKGYEMRQVEVGETSSKEAVITKGLNPGEVITLRQPSDENINHRKLLSDTIQ